MVRPPDAAEFKHDSTLVLTPENQDKAAGPHHGFRRWRAAAPATVRRRRWLQIDPDFKLDLGAEAPRRPPSRISSSMTSVLTLDDVPTAAASAAPAAGGAKDDHWYDVQTKFDLAKAYQEMGDKDGAREILQEVIKEGDTAQQAEAKQLLDTLG